ncbi:hypothetical protein HTZ77_02190 [Nonomuraea sp. SMC257]|uniref:LppX_LprAFG lipoprotein n=1 Tax=Nonomuraea montanisoli TaxID=2741721 RepID=A0A7Y6M076_9ACTN|nr:hypothetical protein [Nonomuraea montanisoli]NUW30243.1 hypothetical protein [Nonomuraea montanisoli]
MKRWITLLAVSLVSTAFVTPPSPARAAVADPVASLNKQIAKRQAVRVVELSGLYLSRDEDIFQVENRGVLILGGTGVGAADMTRTLRPGFRMRDQMKAGAWDAAKVAAESKPNRSIAVDGQLYRSGTLYAPVVPEGRTWAAAGRRSATAAAYGDQPINVFEPATLKTLLATASSKRPDTYGSDLKATMYRGAITFKQLHTVSPTFRALIGSRSLSAVATTKIDWALHVDDEVGQALTLSASWPVSGGRRVGVFTQYPGRDHPRTLRMRVSAPRPAQVAPESSLTGTLPRPSALLDLSFPAGA